MPCNHSLIDHLHVRQDDQSNNALLFPQIFMQLNDMIFTSVMNKENNDNIFINKVCMPKAP